MKRNSQDAVHLEPFELKLPEQFKINPAYEVALPSNCRALIFTDMVWTYAPGVDGRQEKVLKAGWRIVVVNKNGRPARVLVDNYERNNVGGASYSTDDKLNVMFHLQSVALRLVKKKTTQVDEVDPED